MTEEEAKMKWCPFARVVNSTGAFNRRHDGEPGSSLPPLAPCIGSACMAWRWNEAKRTAAFMAAVQERMRQQTKPNFNTAMQEVFAEKGGDFAHTEGRCGLAGATQ